MTADPPQTRLVRALGTRSVTLFGLAYLAPMIILGTFGVLAETTHGTVPSAYLLAFVAMVFTANSYSRMAREYPVSGSATPTCARASTRGPASWSAGRSCSTISSCPW